MMRRKSVPLFFAGLVMTIGAGQAAAQDVRVTVSGEVAPGVYGRVDIGTRPPPPLVYREPKIIVRSGPAAQKPPVYLHVPPGHARNWSKHCKKYDACGEPVYFVRSAEYDRGAKPSGKGKGKGKDG